jgi:hypothetical protein
VKISGKPEGLIRSGEVCSLWFEFLQPSYALAELVEEALSEL